MLLYGPEDPVGVLVATLHVRGLTTKDKPTRPGTTHARLATVVADFVHSAHAPARAFKDVKF